MNRICLGGLECVQFPIDRDECEEAAESSVFS